MILLAPHCRTSLVNLLLLLLLHQFTAFSLPPQANVPGEPTVATLRSADPVAPAQVHNEPRLRLTIERQPARANSPLPVLDRTPAPVLAPPLHAHPRNHFENSPLPTSIRLHSRTGRSPPR